MIELRNRAWCCLGSGSLLRLTAGTVGPRLGHTWAARGANMTRNDEEDRAVSQRSKRQVRGHSAACSLVSQVRPDHREPAFQAGNARPDHSDLGCPCIGSHQTLGDSVETIGRSVVETPDVARGGRRSANRGVSRRVW